MPLAQIIAAQAMRALLAEQRVTAANLANVGTSGYQKGVVAMRSFGDVLAGARRTRAEEATPAATPAATGAPQPVVGLDLAPGRLEQTGNPLDLALEGRGWMVTGSATAPHLVRSGSFTVDARGLLVTSQGEPLLGEDGQPIQVQGRDVRIDADGTVSTEGRVAGRLLRVDVDAAALGRDGASLVPANTVPLRHAQATVRQGWLEGSNVETVGQMVDMIQTLRSFDYLQHVVRAEDEMLQRAANDVGRTR